MKKLSPALVVCLLLLCYFDLTSALRSPRLPRFPKSTNRAQNRADWSIIGGGGGGGVVYSVEYYTQVVDHFSFRNESTFQQRYLIHKDSWTGAANKGPIFLYCGNEGDIEWFAANSGFLWDIAPVYGALILFPEHRYYGESMPYGTEEASYKDANSLSALTSEQALADFATLVIDLKKNLSAEASPVVLFGGSYGGMLAAWMRLKYPHIAIGAVSASAPILQFEDIVPTDTFYRIVSEDFKRESMSCFNYIRDSWDVMDKVASENDGLHNLSTVFHMCRDLTGSSELQNWLSAAYSYLGMVDYPFPANFIMPLPAYPIKEVCRAIDALPEGTDILSRIFAGASVYYNFTGQAACFQPDDTGNVDLGTRGWDWQACTEMVMPMSSNPNNSMFPPYNWDLGAFEQSCMESFHVKPRSTWITTEYGGKDIKSVLKNFGSNIVFSNGLLDPWSGGGVLEDISSSIVALVAPEGAHHLDLRASKEDDPVWLLEQRAAEMTHIEKWLTEFYSGNKLPSERIWSFGPFGIILLVFLYLMGGLIYDHWCRLFDVNWKLSVASMKHSLAI